MKVKFAAAGLAVVAGALLAGVGVARAVPGAGANAGYVLGAGALALGAVVLVHAVTRIVRNP